MADVASLRKGKSPYSKYEKAPYRYSPAYERWASAVGTAGAGHDTEEANAADVAFRRTFGVPITNGQRA